MKEGAFPVLKEYAFTIERAGFLNEKRRINFGKMR